MDFNIIKIERSHYTVPLNSIGWGIPGAEQGEDAPADEPLCPPRLLDLGARRPQPSGSPLGVRCDHKLII